MADAQIKQRRQINLSKSDIVDLIRQQILTYAPYEKQNREIDTNERIVRVEEGLKNLSTQMDRRFDHTDKRFDHTDKRSEQMERHITARFDRQQHSLRWGFAIIITSFAGLFIKLFLG